MWSRACSDRRSGIGRLRALVFKRNNVPALLQVGGVLELGSG